MRRSGALLSPWATWATFCLFLLSWLAATVSAMRPDRIAQLRQETVGMFYHGFDNYMNIAFPEDEVRWNPTPLSWCRLTH